MAHSYKAERLIKDMTDFGLHEIDYNLYLNKYISPKKNRNQFAFIMRSKRLSAAIKTQPVVRIIKRVIYHICLKLLDK